MTQWHPMKSRTVKLTPNDYANRVMLGFGIVTAIIATVTVFVHYFGA
jgi:hypothetical protein